MRNIIIINYLFKYNYLEKIKAKYIFYKKIILISIIIIIAFNRKNCLKKLPNFIQYVCNLLNIIAK